MAVLAYLRSLDPRLPRPVWALELGLLATSIGDGAVAPFLVIYLHDVRGFSLGVAGSIAAGLYGVAIVSGLIAGAVVDRLGARATAVGSLALLAVGFAGFPLVREPWQAFALVTIAGVGKGAFWPAHSSLLAGLTPQARRHAAFALQRVMGNLGIGVGGVTGGLIAVTSHPGTFTVLFVLDAVSFVVFIAALAFVPALELPPLREDEQPGSYRDVLRDRVFVAAILLNALFSAAGYAQLNSMLPVFAKDQAGVSERSIGLIFFLNSMLIVLAQLPVVRSLEGRRRMPALGLMGVVWALAWIVTLAGGLWFSTSVAVALLALAAVVFAGGECLHGAVQSPLIADLAQPRLRGRYMALWLITVQLGLTAGTAAGGFVLALSPYALWIGAAILCALAGFGSLALESRLPRGVRRTPDHVPVERRQPVRSTP